MEYTDYQVYIYFVRHGQSEANLDPSLICGQSIESPLSSLGEEQAVLLGRRFKYENMTFDYILSSTAVRAKRTAEIICNTMNIDTSTMITSEKLLEQDQGLWEGKQRHQCYTDEVLHKMSQSNMDFSSPEGESLRMLQKRAIEYLQTYIEEAKARSITENRKITLVIYTHANLIRAVLQYYLQSDERYVWLIGQGNTAINEIFLNRYGVSAVRVNDTGHLSLVIPGSS